MSSGRKVQWLVEANHVTLHAIQSQNRAGLCCSVIGQTGARAASRAATGYIAGDVTASLHNMAASLVSGTPLKQGHVSTNSVQVWQRTHLQTLNTPNTFSKRLITFSPALGKPQSAWVEVTTVQGSGEIYYIESEFIIYTLNHQMTERKEEKNLIIVLRKVRSTIQRTWCDGFDALRLASTVMWCR